MLENFEGIVLFKRDHKEHDALVKIFTETYGTKMFYIRGLHKGNHPLAPQLIPLTHNKYVGTINHTGLSFIREGWTKQSYKHIQMDFMTQAYGVYLTQLFDAAIEDNRPDSTLYHLLVQVMTKLNEGVIPEVIAAFCEIHLLDYFGVGLNFKHCVECDNTEGPYDFSITHGGLLCKEHWSHDPHRLHLSAKSIHVAYMLANVSIDQINRVKLSRDTLNGLRQLMDEIYKEFVGIKLRGKSYLDKIQAFETKNYKDHTKANKGDGEI